MTPFSAAPVQRRLCLAVDTPDLDAAVDLVRRTKGVVGTVKVGLELWTAHGPAALARLRREDLEVFLDLKLHDIPNTVAAAVREAARHEVTWLTVHASGGTAMLRAAQEALSAQTTIPGLRSTQLLAVTVLTHLTSPELQAIGYAGDAETTALRLAQLAKAAGVAGVVCSPQEAGAVRAALGDSAVVVCPGIRPADAPLSALPSDDQRRTASAYEAVKAGADLVVVGRPVRTAPDPAAAASALLDEIVRGLQDRS
jgi:orotidine-5'-phosphate decarboxylase